MTRSILILSSLSLLTLAPAVSGQGRGRGPAAPPGAAMRPPAAVQARPAAPQARPPAAPQSRRPAEPAAAARGRAHDPDLSRAGRNNGLKAPRDFAKRNNPRLEARVQPMLPPGTDFQTAAMGFKNTGQFVAAANVSKNLGIPFEDLKARMISGESLGQAIQQLRPELNGSEARRQARDAEREAERIIREMQTPPPDNGVQPPPQQP